MTKRSSSLCSAAVFLLLANFSGGNALALESEIGHAMLDNGLQIYVIPDTRSDVVTHALWIPVGSADDPVGKSGMAHLLEHLMFKGTKNTPAGQFEQSVESYGGRQNAFTSVDFTAYVETVPAIALREMMDFNADRLRNATISDDDVETERGVVVSERLLRVENDPSARLNETLRAMLFVHHPYGIPILGWREEMESISREDVRAFYAQHYQPNGAILIVAGNTTLEEVVALAEKTYGDIPQGEKRAPRVRVSEPPGVAMRSASLEDPKVQQPTWRRYYIAPSFSHLAKDNRVEEAYALSVLSHILGGTRTSRLYRSLVSEKKKALAAGSFHQGLNLDKGTLALYAVPAEGVSLEDVEALVEAEIANLLASGVSEKEVERAKRYVRASHIYERDASSSLVNLLGAILTSGGTLEDFNLWLKRFEEVTPESVQAVAQKVLLDHGAVNGYLRRKTPQ